MRDRPLPRPTSNASPEAGRHVLAEAPGGVGNLGPGLDILGCAVTGPADLVEAWRQPGTGVSLVDPGGPGLPEDPARHASGIAATALLAAAAPTQRVDFGVALRCTKQLPLAGGQGGSAASAVAGAAAANALLDRPLDQMAVMAAALVAESALAGRHLDNIAPCVLGGIVLVRSMDPIDVVRLDAPPSLRIVLALPAMQLLTRASRAVLPAQVDRATALHQAGQVAAIVAACATGDLALLGRAIDDRIAEPVRAPLLPGFAAARHAALAAGALGCSISGAGPSLFALTDGDATAAVVAEAVRDAYRRAGVGCSTRVERVSPTGVVVREVASDPSQPTERRA